MKENFFSLSKINYILMAVSFVVVIIGFFADDRQSLGRGI